MGKSTKKWSGYVADMKQKTPDELQTELLNLKKEQFNLRFQAATGQLEKTHVVASVKEKIALVKTVMRQKARASVQAGSAS